MQEQLDRLCDLSARHAGGRSGPTAIPRVSLNTGSVTTGRLPGVYEPMHCVILQGAKEVMIGDRVLRYDTVSCFTAAVEVPASGRVVQASPDRPYIALSLALDRDMLASLLPEVPARPATDRAMPIAGFGVSPVTPALLEVWRRFIALLDSPEDIKVLAPMLERELLYRLLQGPQGCVLRQVAVADSRLSQIRRAIGRIRTHYDQPLRIDDLAALAGMSAASFHRHFKAATTLSPLQYQKILRLQQARRLLIANRDAAQAAYAVGYESTSQFSREYARLFGTPPVRDAERLRGDAGASAEIASAA